jgi:hypothetical protein
VVRLIVGASAFIAGVQEPVLVGRPVAVEGVLRAAAEYVAEYERQISAVVSEESYAQQFTEDRSRRSGARQLRSDLLTISDSFGGWIGFRDVYEVDGKRVRDRDERLARLFLQDRAGSLPEARRIADESARFNLEASVARTINTPLFAVQFIRASNQGRSTFKSEGVKSVNGLDAVVLRFEERTKPRLVRTDDDAPARGRFWIEPASGRILQTELSIETATGNGLLTSLIQVTYAQQSKVGVWLPVSMEETYRSGGIRGLVIRGHATYANFRKFTVDTSTVVK